MVHRSSRSRQPGLARCRLGVAVAIALVLFPISGASAQSATTAPPPAPPRASILVDIGSGLILEGRNIHTRLPPASTVKLMTALVAIEKLSPEALIGVSALTAGRPAMRVGMKEGEQWRLADALRSMLMVSANDAAYALAEAAAGSLEQYATQAQAAAARYGMRDSLLTDPAGLDDSTSFKGGSRMSAYDLAIAARNVLSVRELAEIAATREYRFVGPDGAEHTLTNHNKLLTTHPYTGALGLKTGRTSRAGSTFVAAARRDGRTLVAVVLGAGDIYGAATALLDRGFSMPRDARGTGERIPAPKVVSFQTAAARAAAAAARQREAARIERTAASDAGGFGAWLGAFGKVALVALVVAVVLRRRAVVRRRRRRRARARAMWEARRRGSLHILDTEVERQSGIALHDPASPR